MKNFTALYLRLDQTNATNEKVRAITDYLARASGHDAAWAIWFLSGRRLKRLLKRAALRRWVLEETGYPEWMLEETYHAVGDLAETIALLLPEPTHPGLDETSLAHWITDKIMPLAKRDEIEQGEVVKGWWRELSGDSRFVLNKLFTGALRVGVSQRLVVRALAQYLARDSAVIAHRMMGDWQPGPDLLTQLTEGRGAAEEASQPYPFYLASPLQQEPEGLGASDDWLGEWKWDGIRAQLIRRNGQTFIWSRGEERLDGRFPELEAAAAQLPDGVVLDGEILARDERGRFQFATLQRRIGRLRPGKKLLQEAPVTFMAYDLLELEQEDIRERPLTTRRRHLETLLAGRDDQPLAFSPAVTARDWTALKGLRDESRERGVEGLILKRMDGRYLTGRKRGEWWKWKIDPYTIDTVLLYAQPGSGRRSNLLTDYTFGVWRKTDGQAAELVPVCKAYSGLTNVEIERLDRWIRQHTLERFGPVRSVAATQVFEIAFEGIQHSKRHKSGVAFRFPRIARWREDLSIADAETLDQVRTLIGPIAEKSVE